jgi:xylose isomerase
MTSSRSPRGSADGYFPDVEAVRYEGPATANPLAYRWYDPTRIVLGKTMAEQLRIAVCAWHGFGWTGSDMFGAPTFDRAWLAAADPLQRAEQRLDAMMEFVQKLGVKFYVFHDRDLAPELGTMAESRKAFAVMVEKAAEAQERIGVRLLWGTANLFSHPRYMAGAATNPDPEVFACAALQVRDAMEATKRLGGGGYALWGGREGYDTLLNTDLKREAEQLGRFVTMAVEHKHKIGLEGPILIEPKPMEPAKHQYDRDVATVFGFLQRFGLEKEVGVNLECNHATLAGHSFEHEVATALALGIFGSVDANRGDPQNGWDTDQFPNDVTEMSLALYHILQAGGLRAGGFNFDAKVRRQSIDPVDLFHAHIGGMDTLARALLVAAAMVEDGRLKTLMAERYAGWDGELGRRILSGELSLAAAADYALAHRLEPAPRSGRQEMLENLVSRYVQAAAPAVVR